MVKSTKSVKIVAVIQLFIGFLMAIACFGGILLPYLDIVKVHGVDYKVSSAILEEEQDKFDLALNEYYPEHKAPKKFWDKFSRIVVYDVIWETHQVSFCIKRNYKLWGISLGKLEKTEDVRYVVDRADNMKIITDDINLGVICTETRIVRTEEK